MPEDRGIDQKDNGVFPLTWIDFGLGHQSALLRTVDFVRGFVLEKQREKI